MSSERFTLARNTGFAMAGVSLAAVIQLAAAENPSWNAKAASSAFAIATPLLCGSSVMYHMVMFSSSLPAKARWLLRFCAWSGGLVACVGIFYLFACVSVYAGWGFAVTSLIILPLAFVFDSLVQAK